MTSTSYAYAHTLNTSASPAAVYALWSDPAGWPDWDTSVRAVTLTGPFAVGTGGTMELADAPTVEFTITEVDPGVGFTDETPIPGGILRFRHRVVARPDGGATITHWVEIDGAEDIAMRFGPAVTADVPESMAALAARAESLTVA